MNLFCRGKVSVRESKLEDILVLRETMRKEDRAEIWASWHSTPEKSLLFCYTSSLISHTVLREDKPIAMFGVLPDEENPERGQVWFLGSDDLERVPKSFLVGSRLFLKGMLEMCPLLYNHVDARYEKSIRWLRRLGAELEEAKPYGLDGLPFHYLTFRRT